jgi:hypothetical protein
MKIPFDTESDYCCRGWGGGTKEDIDSVHIPNLTLCDLTDAQDWRLDEA